MKISLYTFLVFLFLAVYNAKAQYVTISDTAMVNWLSANYPSAMVGNQMDTTNVNILSAQTFDPGIWPNIENCDGLQYFDGLTYIKLSNWNLATIPAFPANVQVLVIDGTSIQSLPSLPSGLLDFTLTSNSSLTNLPAFPNTLQSFVCFLNNITLLPNLPNSLTYLDCQWSDLTALPTLPNSLVHLNCKFNSLSSLPNLPNTLKYLNCEVNPIPYLPALPPNLETLMAHGGNLLCLPILPESLMTLQVASNPLNCLPNYPSQLSYFDSQGLPLCQPNNLNGCVTTGFISGALFYNGNGSCVNTGDLTSNASFHLFDNQNNFLQSRSAGFDNNYYFSIQPGTYKVRIDSSFTSNSMSLSCPPSGEYLVTALQDSVYSNLDFGIKCVGIDLGVEAILPQGIVFPDQAHSLKVMAGDLSNFFNDDCASGTGGTVQISVNGPVTYIGFPSSALSPAASGNSYTYTISDFGNTNIHQSFVLNFVTDATAQSGDTITVSATIISDSIDLDASNNTLLYSYVVVNSYDPNMKQVNPVNVLPGFEDYFTYTVHFQNLGTVAAYNIRIKDTIDAHLDTKTLRFINSSHNYSFNLINNVITVNFPNVMLPDSTSNPEGSKGFIQYQVKPKPNLPLGTTIDNTAHIFFDFNPAVVTNTTTNTYVETLSSTEVNREVFLVYPNPSSGQITIARLNATNDAIITRIFDLTGKVLMNETLIFENGKASLQTDLASGSYVLFFESETGITSSHSLMITR